MDGQHTYLTGPWHYCGICDEKTKLKHMKWQKGVLRCHQCVDKKLIGDREAVIQAVLSDGKRELALDPKLRHPAIELDSGDITISGI